MSNGIVICTNNLVPAILFRRVLTNAFVQADILKNTSVVVVSHYPVFEKNVDLLKNDKSGFKRTEHKNFSDVLLKTPVFNTEGFSCEHINLVVGECEYNHSTIYRQLLLGMCCYADNIIIMEHDVLYPMNYTKTVAGILDSGMDLCYWARGKYFSDLGFFDLPNIMTLSRFSMKRKQFVKVFENKKNNDLKFVEPALRGLEIQGDFSKEIVTDNFAMVHGIDTLDIRHGLNVSGNYIVENYSQGHSYWGDYSEIYPMIDGPCRRLVESHPSYNYGIWN